MKKLILSALALAGFISLSVAQTAPAKMATPPAKSKMTVVKKEVKPAATAKLATMPATKPVVTPTPKPTVTVTPVKKDGTPDKRFKANAATAGPLKKDGTKDMRFKANKKS